MLKILFYFKLYLQKVIMTFLYLLFFYKRVRSSDQWVLLFQTAHLGDVLCSLPVLKKLTEYYHSQGFKVAVVTDIPYCWIIKHHIPCDDCMGIKEKQALDDLFYRTRMMLPFFFRRSQILISINANNALIAMEVFTFAKQKIRVQLKTKYDFLFQQAYSRYFDKTIEMFFLSPIHDQFSRIFFEITGQKMQYELTDFKTTLPAVGKKPFFQEKYYIVLPGADAKQKTWEPRKYANLINHIQQDFPEYKAVIMGTRGDGEFELEILNSVDRNNVIPLSGKTDLQDFFAWMRHASFVLGNDSGGIHLAALYRIPFFAMLNCADFDRFLPNPYYQTAHYFYKKCADFPCYWFCKHLELNGLTRYPCITELQPENVYPEIKIFLQTHKS